MKIENIYKYAAQKRLRFSSPKGTLTVEDLFHLPLETLDDIYRSLKKLEAGMKTDSLLLKGEADEKLDVALQIVIDVFTTKKAEADKAKAAIELERKRQRIAEVIEKKEGEDLESKSIEELRAMLTE